nr:hypothetical protein [Tanacetum cinerariifolium]
MAPRAVLIKTGLRPLNTARPVNTAHPKTTVYSARPMSFFLNQHNELPRAVNTAMPNSAVVNAVRANQINAVKASPCWVLRPTKLNSALITLKKHNYVDARGRFKNLMVDMLPLVEKPNKEKLLMCDKKNNVLFTDTGCFVLSLDFKLTDESHVLLKVPRKNNMYSVEMKNIVPKESLTCLVAKATLDESMLWRKRLGHANFKTINKLVKENLVRGLPTKHFENDQTCVACLKGKQHKASCIKKEFSVARTPQQNCVAERRNRTLIEAARTMLVVKPYNKTPYELFRGRTHALSFMRPFGCHVTILNSLDHLGKFDGKSDDGFFIGYSLYSKAFRVYNIRTRKVEENLHIRYNSNDFVGTEESIGAGHASKVTRSSHDYILMPLWKDGSLFDSFSNNASNDEPQPSSNTGIKDDEGVSKESRIDLSTISTTYLVPSTPNTRIHKDYSLDHVIGDVQSGVQTKRMTKTTSEQGFISAVYEGKTQTDLHTCLFACFLSQEEPNKVIQALKDPSLIEAMQNELLEFKLQQVWTLVDLPYGKRAIVTKWICRNKKDKRGIMVRNKARLVTQGHTQAEGIYYDDVFSPVARIEAIRLFLAYASFKDFVVYQMYVKSAFLYGRIEEEVYVYQPSGFEDPEFPDRVYKTANTLMETSKPLLKDDNAEDVDVHLYRSMIVLLMYLTSSRPDIMSDVCACARFQVTPKVLHLHDVKRIFRYLKGQPKLGLWYPKDSPFDLEAYIDSDYASATLDRKSITRVANTLMETSKPLLKDENVEDVDVHLYRSMIGSLMYLTSSRPDIMFDVCACEIFQVTPKVLHLHVVKRIFRYLKGQTKLGLWYPKDSPFDLEAYIDSDYASATLDKKSITGGYQFLRSRLISWQCKKQTIVANSTTEAEYVAASNCCRQVLWIQNQMMDYGYNFMNTKIFIDNESTICIVKNLMFHSKTKHIEIQHHFIRDSNENKLLQMIKIQTDQNVTYLLTKEFDVGRFQYLVASIGMINL